MFKTILKNLKTTLAGSIAGFGILETGIESGNVTLIISGVATILLGLLASDSKN